MLFMVVEKFKDGDARSIGERFKLKGRMLPDGLIYRDSWVDPRGPRCFQIVETEKPQLIGVWTSHWEDLVDFEVVPVLTSNEFWSKIQSGDDGHS